MPRYGDLTIEQRAYQNQRNQVASKREDLQASTQDFVKNRYVPTENKREDTEKRYVLPSS